MCRARLPSIFITSHKMPRLPRNLHLVATWRSRANAVFKSTQHDTSKVLRLPRKMAKDTSKVLRLPACLPACVRACLPACLSACHTHTQNDFRHVTKHAWMSRSATPATRNEATPHVKPPKVKSDPFCRTYHRHGHTGIARTVANGCGRLRTVGQRRANTPSTPDPQSETGTLAMHSGKSWCYGW